MIIDLLNKILFFFKSEVRLAILIVVGSIFLAIILQVYSTKFIGNSVKETQYSLSNVDNIQSQLIEEAYNQNKNYSMCVLIEQFNISKNLKEYHKNIAVMYYKNYYAFSVCLIFFSVLLSISVFLVANQGFQNASLVKRVFFLTMIFFSSYYYFLPNVFDSKKNINENLDRVKKLNEVQYDILSLSKSYKYNEEKEVDSVIANFYKRISEEFDFINNIDDTKLNSSTLKLFDNLTIQK